MTTVMPEGKAVRRAVQWISGELQENPNKSIQMLVDGAVLRFDLSPKEADFLTNFYHTGKIGGKNV
jgi:hypothetical protein